MRSITKALSKIVVALTVTAGALVPMAALAPSASATTPPVAAVTQTVSIATSGLGYRWGSATDSWGNVWVAASNKVIKINPVISTVQHFDVSPVTILADSLVVDTDDTVWIGTNSLPGGIVHLSSEGAILGSWFLSDSLIGGFQSITIGPDGNLWFSARSGNKVGKFSTTTHAFTLYSSGTTDSPTSGLWYPRSITTGPDGNLWVANYGDTVAGRGQTVSKITTAGVVTTYDLSVSVTGAAAIVDGGDGYLYVANSLPSGASGSIVRLSTTGLFMDFADSRLTYLVGLVVGSDHRLWAYGNAKLVSLDLTSFTFDSLNLPAGVSIISALQARDGSIWSVDQNNDNVLRTGIGVPESPSIPRVISTDATHVSAEVSTAARFDGGSAITSWTLWASNGASCTTTLPASACSITGLTAGTPYTFTTTFANANGSSPRSATTPEFVPGGSGFTALASPTRIFDSRNGTGTTVGTFAAGEHRSLVVTGHNGVPATATAVLLNVGAVGASVSSNGWAAVVPTAASFVTPTVSSLNFVSGRAFSNAVTVQVGTGGSIDFFNKNGTVNLFADLIGYYEPSSGATVITTTPFRVFDTRNGTGTTVGRFAAGEHRNFDVVAAALLPASATAVVVNVTATAATDPTNGWAAVVPTPAGGAGGWTIPTTSSLNFTSTSGAVATMVTCGIGVGGQITLFNKNGEAHLIVDLVGAYFNDGSGSRFFPLTPTRVFDTRTGTGGVSASPIGSGSTIHPVMRGVGGVPSSTNVDSVLFNLGATTGTNQSWLGVHPTGQPRGTASSINFLSGKSVANLVLAQIGNFGAIDIYNSVGTANAFGDVAGFFAGRPLSFGG